MKSKVVTLFFLGLFSVLSVSCIRTNLSKSGTANCYIVTDAGLYKFNATVKGGSMESIGTPVSAEVLWESFGTNTFPSVGDLVDNVSYSDGYVNFKASEKKGNAVIAVKDVSGKILWSWHIWLTDQPEEQVYNNNAGTMMDRNLGATSAIPGDVKSLGLLYQWGRKDPFLSGFQSAESFFESQQIAASTIIWPSTASSNSSTGTISYAVSHPTTFITYNASNYDWYYTGSSSTDNTRWQTTDKSKGIYDPCPPGWRVPDDGDNGVWAKAFGSPLDYENGPWDNSTDSGMNFGSTNGMASSMQLGSSSIIWYPASGYRHYSGGSPISVGYGGYCWSCTPYGDSAYDLYFDSGGNVSPSSSSFRAIGKGVRCLSE